MSTDPDYRRFGRENFDAGARYLGEASPEALRDAFRSTGNPLHVLVLRKGANAELSSGIPRAAYQDMKFKAGVARASNGDPMVSPEGIVLINVPWS